MSRSLALLLLLWLLLQNFALAPPTRPDLGPWLADLTLGRWGGEEPLVVALYWLMGVWPLLWLVRLRDELLARPLPALPFVIGSLALGCFVLLPYLVLRPTGGPPPSTGRLARALSHPVWPAALGGAATGLAAWGLILGDFSAFADTWRSEGFVHVMSLDFVCLWAAFSIFAREAGGPGGGWTALPVIGAAAWLWERQGRLSPRADVPG